MRPRRSVALAGLTALAVAGCGGSSPPARQFRASATRVCTSAATRAARIPTPAAPSGAVTFLRRGLTVLTPELARLRRVRPPLALASDYATALAGFSDELSALRSAVEKLSSGADPVSTTAALQHRLSPIESRTNRAWRALDLPGCVER